MLIQRGPVSEPQRIALYGPEGIGKTTFAAQFPNAVIVDLEGGSKQYDVARTLPKTWQESIEHIGALSSDPNVQTIAVDTADKAEEMCIAHLLRSNNWRSIETPGYGKGYVALAEEFQRMLSALDMAVANGKTVLVLAHAQMRKFEQPDEMGSYDRWELKLNKKTAPLVKEWSDALLFANFKTNVEKVGDGQGAKYKARGSKRVMYCTHDACWDAKNRWGKEHSLPFEFASIADKIGCCQEPPMALPQLMERDGITAEMVEEYAWQSGNVQSGTKIGDFPEGYLGFITANWDAFKAKCLECVPF